MSRAEWNNRQIGRENGGIVTARIHSVAHYLQMVRSWSLTMLLSSLMVRSCPSTWSESRAVASETPHYTRNSHARTTLATKRQILEGRLGVGVARTKAVSLGVMRICVSIKPRELITAVPFGFSRVFVVEEALLVCELLFQAAHPLC